MDATPAITEIVADEIMTGPTRAVVGHTLQDDVDVLRDL